MPDLRAMIRHYDPPPDLSVGNVVAATFMKRPAGEILPNGNYIVVRYGRLKITLDSGQEFIIEIPEGFKCDSASIGYLFRSVVSKYNCTNAGVAHDFFYTGAVKITRKNADLIFYNLMLENDVIWSATARLAYRAVRIGGGRYFIQYHPDIYEKIMSECRQINCNLITNSGTA